MYKSFYSAAKIVYISIIIVKKNLGYLEMLAFDYFAIVD